MGYIIVIEGTDGSGKRTQTMRLYERLLSEGYNVRVQSFPNYDSMSAGGVKMYLNGDFGDSDKSLDAYQASALYAVDRLCTYNKDLKEFYENGGIIVFDRYIESNMLHQAGKIASRVEVDKYLDWLCNLEYDTFKLPKANKVLFLDVPVEISKRLANAREDLKNNMQKDIHESSKDHLTNAYNASKYVSVKFGWEIINCVENDEMRSIEDIGEEIYNKVISDIKEVSNES